MSLQRRHELVTPRLPIVLLIAGLIAASIVARPAHAQAVTPTPASGDRPEMPSPSEPTAARETTASAGSASIYDRVWRFAEWYRNDQARVVQRVQFTGRFQQDYARVDSRQGDHAEWNIRRFRVGGRVTMMRTWLVHAEVELNPQERDPLYVRFTDAYLQWTKSARFVVTAGKQGVPFTSEGATSSRDLVAIDRSNLANNIWFPQEYMTGISASGRAGPWAYRAGLYSSGAMNRELGELNGGVFTLAVIGYDFGQALGLREAMVTANYVYQPEDEHNTFTRSLRHVVSVHTRVDDPRWGLRTDVATATGYLDQPDLWSVMGMPFANVTPVFQLVGRYTVVGSRGTNGVRLASYESRVVPGRGDRYDEWYIGANYYVYAHRLKLQTGFAWGEMDDRADDGGEYSGVVWTSGLRVGW